MQRAKLTPTSVKKFVSVGEKQRIGDGAGLWLDVRAPGRGQWVFRYTRQGRARELGLGAVVLGSGAETSEALEGVRAEAEAVRRLLRQGQDPLEVRARQQAASTAEAARAAEVAAREARTFKSVAEEMLGSLEAQWSNPKHRQQWRNTLSGYANPVLGSIPVAEVTTEHVLAVLQPLWLAKPETASRLRGRVERVLDFAKARKWREGENPAAWRGNLKFLLASPRKVRRNRHHPALPWRQVSQFMAELRSRNGMSAKALEMAILTACRSGEVRGMRWGEVDLEARTWSIPAARMKARREHRVPLSEAAVRVLEEVRVWRTSDGPEALVFPNRDGRPLSDMSLAKVLRDAKLDGRPRWIDKHGVPVVPHGFRSTFRDWCAERRGEPREVAEAALAHTLGSETEVAYARSDLFDRRVVLMDAWARFCDETPGVVVPLQRASGAA